MKTENAISSQRVSPLSLSEWNALQTLAQTAHAALSALDHALVMQAAKLNNDPHKLKNDPQTVLALMDEAAKIDACRHSLSPAYFYQVQGEWLGGESFAQREPHLMGTRRLTVNE